MVVPSQAVFMCFCRAMVVRYLLVPCYAVVVLWLSCDEGDRMTSAILCWLMVASYCVVIVRCCRVVYAVFMLRCYNIVILSNHAMLVSCDDVCCAGVV